MNINDKVAIARCGEYDNAKILSSLRIMAEQIGINEEDIKGKRVVLKPNLLLAYAPEKAATTHPEVMIAAVLLFKEMGASSVMIAESPGGIYSDKTLDKTYRETGMSYAAEKSGAELNRDLGWTELSTPDGRVSKKVNVINPIYDADVIVNVCKLKTHALAVMTAAAKNLFGVIPGITKFEMHARFKKPTDFFTMLIDLDTELARRKKIINICDAIVGMEGDGPSGGTPKDCGLLLMSFNPFNLDTVAARIMGFEGRVELLSIASKQGLCPSSAKDIEVCGTSVDEIGSLNFALPDAAKGRRFDLIPPFLQPRPVIDKNLCRGCGLCVKSCPQHTIELRSGKAKIIASSCIKCYCCQELCTFKAVRIKKSIIYKIVK